jgi:hypothetical protein
MSTNDWDIHIVQSHTLLLCQKCISTNHIQCGHTKHFLGIIRIFGLENLYSNCNSGFHWVADDIDKCVGAMVSNSFNKTSHDASVAVEQIISSHSGFTGHSNWDKHKVDTLQCIYARALGISTCVCSLCCPTSFPYASLLLLARTY